MLLQRFFEEVIRRKVLPVAVAYAIGGWILLQVGDVLIGLLELPGWTGKILVAAVAIGLPVALFLSWVYDWTPKGIVATPASKHFEFAELGSIEIGQLDLGRPQLTPLFGRSAECEIIAGRLDEAATGEGGVVLIGGEPGVGKTRLGEEVLELGLERHMLPLIGHAYEETRAPLITSTEILENITRMLPPDTLRAALGATAPEISLLLPDIRRVLPDIPEPPDVPPEQRQRYLFNAMLEFVQRLGKSAPLVILLDDMQWADESSIMLLEHFLPHLPRMPVLMVITYRDVDADMGEPFKRVLGTLTRQESVTRIPLRQLSKEDVATLLENLSGAPAPDAVVATIFEETSGNVFFVKSVYQHLAEEERLFDASGKWLTDIDPKQLAVPESVRLVVERRVKRLGESAAKILTLAGVSGLRFDLAVLEHAFSDAPGDVLDAIEEAERAGLVIVRGGQREDRYEFSHALVRHALMDALSRPRRRLQHRLVAQTIEALYADRLEEQFEVLSYHYNKSRDWEKALYYLEMAGDKAARNFALLDARSHYRDALELIDSQLNTQDQKANGLKARQIEISLKWAQLSQYAGDDTIPVLETALTYAGELNDKSKIAHFTFWLGQRNYVLGNLEQAMEQFSDCIALAQESNDKVLLAKAHGSKGRMHFYLGEYQKANQLLKKAIPVLEELGEQDESIYTGVVLAWSYAFTGDFEKAFSHVEKGIKFFEETGNLSRLAYANYVLGTAHGFQGNWGKSIEAHDRSSEIARSLGDVIFGFGGTMAGGYCLFMSGRRREGLSKIQEAFEGYKANQLYFTYPICYGFLAHCYAQAGRLEEAIDNAEKCLEWSPKWKGYEWLAYFSLAIAEAQKKHADPTAVDQWIEKGLELSRQRGQNPHLAQGYFEYAKILFERGDVQRAQDNLKQANELFAEMKMLWWVEQATELEKLLN